MPLLSKLKSSYTRYFIASLLCLLPAAKAFAAPPIDPSSSLQLFPMSGLNDGMLVQSARVGETSVHIQASGMYMYNVLGGDNKPIPNRITAYPSVDLSLFKWLQLGASLPVLAWQNSPGYTVTSSAIGDVQVYGKFHIPIPFLDFAVALGAGIPTAGGNTAFGANQLTLYPKLLIGKSFFSRFHLNATLGGALPLSTANDCVTGTGCGDAINRLGKSITYGAHASLDLMDGKFVPMLEVSGAYVFDNASNLNVGNFKSYPIVGVVGAKGKLDMGLTYGVSYIQGLATTDVRGAMVNIGWSFGNNKRKAAPAPKADE